MESLDMTQLQATCCFQVNLPEVSLKQGDHFVQLKVNGMQRIKTKTSKCGSVVEFKTSEGVLTVDDYAISADDQLARYLQQACYHKGRKSIVKHMRPNQQNKTDMDISCNGGTPKSSSLIRFSFINHLFWGTPMTSWEPPYGYGHWEVSKLGCRVICRLAWPMSWRMVSLEDACQLASWRLGRRVHESFLMLWGTHGNKLVPGDIWRFPAMGVPLNHSF